MLASPGFKDPRTRWRRCLPYNPLRYEGQSRVEMMETVACRWIGGALHDINMRNGTIEGYAIVGGSGTGKTRFLGEIFERWDHLRALSIEATKTNPAQPVEIPSNTLLIPLTFHSKCTVTASERDMIRALMDDFKMNLKVFCLV